MTISVVVLKSAEADLFDIRHYIIKNFGRTTWNKSYNDLKKSFKQISAYPEAGRIPDELNGMGMEHYRQILSGMNRIIYELRDNTAYIHIVCDTRRDLKDLLMTRVLRPGSSA